MGQVLSRGHGFGKRLTELRFTRARSTLIIPRRKSRLAGLFFIERGNELFDQPDHSIRILFLLGLVVLVDASAPQQP